MLAIDHKMILTQCAVCATDLGLSLGKKCGRCSTRYCGAECQVQHWKEGGHDKLCKKIKRNGGAEQYNANSKYAEAVAVAVEKCADDTKPWAKMLHLSRDCPSAHGRRSRARVRVPHVGGFRARVVLGTDRMPRSRLGSDGDMLPFSYMTTLHLKRTHARRCGFSRT